MRVVLHLEDFGVADHAAQGQSAIGDRILTVKIKVFFFGVITIKLGRKYFFQ